MLCSVMCACEFVWRGVGRKVVGDRAVTGKRNFKR